MTMSLLKIEQKGGRDESYLNLQKKKNISKNNNVFIDIFLRIYFQH